MKGKKTILTLTSLMPVLALVSCNGGDKLKDEILQKIIVDSSDYQQCKADFYVGSIVKHDDVTYDITWTENSDNIEIKEETVDGNKMFKVDVTRPDVGEENEAFTLTAEIEIKGKKYTKSFEGTLMAETASSKVYTDASDFLDAINDEKINPFVDEVNFEGIVTRKYFFSHYVTDANGDSIVVNKIADDIKVGDKVKVTGNFAAYYTMLQFNGKCTEEVLASDQTLPELSWYKGDSEKVYTPAELLAEPVAKGDIIHGQRVKITGIVEDDGQGITLRDPNNFEDTIVVTKNGFDKDGPLKPALIEATEGKLVTWDAIYYCYHEKEGEGIQPYVLYDDVQENIPAGAELTGDMLTKHEIFKYQLPGLVSGNLDTVWSYKTKDGEVETEHAFDLTYTAEKVEDVLYIAEDGKVTLPKKSVVIPSVKILFTSKEDSTKTFEKTVENVIVGIPELQTLGQILTDKDPEKLYFVKAQFVFESDSKNMVVYDNVAKRYYHVVKDPLDKCEPNTEITFSAKYHKNTANKIVDEIVLDNLLLSEEAEAHVLDTTDMVDLDKAQNDAFYALYNAHKTDGSHLTVDEAKANETLAPYFSAMENGRLVRIACKSYAKDGVASVGFSVEPKMWKIKDFVKNIEVDNSLPKDTPIYVYVVVDGHTLYTDGGFSKFYGYGIGYEVITETPAPDTQA